jgi:hypothetical protein
VIGHMPPLLRNVDELLPGRGVARLFGEVFALSPVGTVLVCLGCQGHHSRCVRYMANVTGEESFHQTCCGMSDSRHKISFAMTRLEQRGGVAIAFM